MHIQTLTNTDTHSHALQMLEGLLVALPPLNHDHHESSEVETREEERMEEVQDRNRRKRRARSPLATIITIANHPQNPLLSGKNVSNPRVSLSLSLSLVPKSCSFRFPHSFSKLSHRRHTHRHSHRMSERDKSILQSSFST